MDPRQGRTRRRRYASFLFAAIVVAGIAAGCGGTATVGPATATLSPPAGDGGYGWYRTGPVMTLAGTDGAATANGLQYSTDGGNNWQNYSAPVTLPETGGTTVSYRATDIWGLPVTGNGFYYYADRTPPVVTYSGNKGFYWPGEYVFIECSAADALSGVARSSCYPIQGEGRTFGYGTSAFSATAGDYAGNEGQGSTSFQVMDPIIFMPLDPNVVFKLP